MDKLQRWRYDSGSMREAPTLPRRATQMGAGGQHVFQGSGRYPEHPCVMCPCTEEKVFLLGSFLLSLRLW